MKEKKLGGIQVDLNIMCTCNSKLNWTSLRILAVFKKEEKCWYILNNMVNINQESYNRNTISKYKTVLNASYIKH